MTEIFVCVRRHFESARASPQETPVRRLDMVAYQRPLYRDGTDFRRAFLKLRVVQYVAILKHQR
jgi:hypothetical protein